MASASGQTPAVRRIRVALAILEDSAPTPRERLVMALTSLAPLVTNTTGLSDDERTRFHRILDRTTAYVDLDAWDLGRGVAAAPEGWVASITSELVELLNGVVERAENSSQTTGQHSD